MIAVRRFVSALCIVVGVWVLASVGGLYFDSANTGFWSASLMWSLLSSLLVAPALVMIYTAPSSSSGQEREPAPSPSSSEADEKAPFVEGGGAHVVSEEEGTAEGGERPDWVESHTE